MTSIFSKISVITLVIAALFVVAFTFTNVASAQVSPDSGTGCTDCGGSTGGATTVGGGSTGGGGTTTVIPAPVCDISANKQYVNPGEQYTISWANGSTGSYKVGGVAVERTGFLTYTWNADNIFLTFTVTGVNSAGVTCSDTVTVYRQVEAPTCDITTNLTAVNDGQTFTISWRGTPSHSTVFKVNNQIVAAVDSQTYTWPAGRTTPVTVTMTGKNAKGECTDSVTVYPKSNPPAVPVCDFLNASPATITRGQSAILSWGTTNVTSASLNNGIGNVAVDGSRTVSPLETTTYTLTAVGANNQQVTCSRTITVTPVVVHVPVCDYFNANPTTITRGQSSTLSWGTTNVSSVSINNGVGSVAVDGSVSVSPTETTTYTLTAVGANNQTVTCAKAVVVNQPEVKTPVCDFFNASPVTITRGQSAELSWGTTNVTSVSINNGIGNVAVDGTRTVSPTDTTTYTLTAVGANNQTVTCSKTITVTPVVVNAPSCDFLSASPTTITRGQSATLSWGTTNATQVTINNGIGNVEVDGSRTVSPLETTTYTLTATGATNPAATCQKTIVVEQSENKVPRCESFNASATTITRGNSVTLTWDTTNANTVVINPGVGTVAADGSTTVSPSETTTYTLTITGDNGQTASCTKTISVETGGGGGGGSSSPKCTLKISDTKITRGDRITLKWDTSRATEVTLKDSHGKTLVTTDGKRSDDKKDLYDGEITLRPEKDTTYTLLAERGSKDRTCKVSVDVSGGVTVTEIRDQKPVVTGIALTQVPYTGFEAGPFLTMLFYGLLLLWALYLAYVLVVRKNGGNSMAFASATPLVASTPAVVNPVIASTSVATPRFIAATPAPVVATPVIGYAAAATAPVDTAYEAVAAKIEDAAHAQRVLISSEAMRHFISVTTDEIRSQMLEAVLAKAKASYPSEDGWVVLSIDRMKSVTAAMAPTVSVFTPRTING